MLENVVAGSIAGGATYTMVYPLDFVRTRVATDVGRGPQVGSGGSRHFTGMIDALRWFYRYQGIRGLYPGYAPGLLTILIHRAVFFGGYDTARELLLPKMAEAFDHLPLLHPHPDPVPVDPHPVVSPGTHPLPQWWHTFLIAQFVSTMAGLITYPFDTISRRMMMMSGRKQSGIPVLYSSARECFRKTLKVEGIRGFFRGAHLAVLMGPAGAVMLVAYEFIRHGDPGKPRAVHHRSHKSSVTTTSTATASTNGKGNGNGNDHGNH